MPAAAELRGQRVEIAAVQPADTRVRCGVQLEPVVEEKAGQRVGSVPKYALWPAGGFCATTFFYKHL